MTEDRGSGSGEQAPGPEPSRTRRAPRVRRVPASLAFATDAADTTTEAKGAVKPRRSSAAGAEPEAPVRRPRKRATKAASVPEPVAQAEPSLAAAPSPVAPMEPSPVVPAEPVAQMEPVAVPVAPVAVPVAPVAQVEPVAVPVAPAEPVTQGEPVTTASPAAAAPEPTRMADPAPTTTTSIGDIESSTPGRTRVRVKRELRTPEAMAQIQAQLSEHDDVSEVSVNARTGSVVIHHDTSRHGSAIIHDVIKDSELVGETVLDIPEDGGDYARMDQKLADTSYQVREWIYARTGIRTGGVLLPAAIAGTGVAQILIVGISIEMLPGPILLYIAYDIYRRGRQEPALVRKHAAQPLATPA